MSRDLPDGEPVESVLDRLIDEDPKRKTDPPRSPARVLEAIKSSLGRDLQDLLNTRCRASSLPKGLKQLDRSIANYGIPDCVGINTGSLENREQMRLRILSAVNTFETRLRDVSVEVSESDDPTDRTLRFRIDGVLWVNPFRQSVAYDSELDSKMGDFHVRSRTG
ncbi:MAG: type VI secretion system baseplate subunit TssE [Planctomycetota bacterium]